MLLSSHQLTMSYKAFLTSGFSQFKSGWRGDMMCMKYCYVSLSYLDAGPLKMDSQLFGNLPSSPSRQMYQSRFGLSLEERDSMNHGCSSLVWLITKSKINFIPRR